MDGVITVMQKLIGRLYLNRETKVKVILSKGQWEKIGQKSGWMNHVTKGYFAEEKYGSRGITFDSSLPQDFVDKALREGYNVLPHFVWIYPKGSVFGEPGPLTNEAIDMLATPKFQMAVMGKKYPSLDLIRREK